MNDLEIYFFNNTKRKIHKWLHYFDIYDQHFHRFKNLPVRVLEIGVRYGGSLQMWKNYFGEKAQIFGIDIDKNCFFKEERIHIEIGSQEDRIFLRDFVNKHANFDIIIDDGGHTMNQQIVSLEELYPSLNNGGIYLIEDLHTSYSAPFGGGFKNPDSLIEYSKQLIDQVNKRTSDSIPNDNRFSQNLVSLHFHEDIVVL